MNKLKNENSIYLLQHADNPLDWFPWGEEALSKAKSEDKPIFLSIGYAACHWCHVMEKETFMDPTAAEFMNRYFISIKVDREERPDLDKIYMDAVMALTGQGGWPLSVFLTPDGYPFYGGTYFPPTPRYGMPSFMQLVSSINEAWRANRDALLQQAETVTSHIRENIKNKTPQTPLSEQIIQTTVAQITNQVDAVHGGWGTSPKFPHPIVLDYLLLNPEDPQTKKAITLTLNAMIQGGMYDVVRGGFHRYSTDNVWRLPHFEKMLYDNAQLPLNYLTAGVLFDNPTYLCVAENTLDFIKNELMDSSGLFWASIDADSDGQEGKYYIWDKEELVKELVSAGLSTDQFELLPNQQIEGQTVVRFSSPNPTQQIHDLNHPLFKKLRSLQAQRNRPITDDKILTDWNALAIRAFAYGAWILNRPDYKAIATRAADQLLANLVVDTQLRHSARQKNVGQSSFLSDYANFINALIDLFYLEKDKNRYAQAAVLTDKMIELFYSEGVFYDTPLSQPLIMRPKTLEDNVMPSGTSAALLALLKLNLIHNHPGYLEIIETSLTANLDFISHYSLAASNWLQVLQHWFTPPAQLIVVLPHAQASEIKEIKTLKTALPYLGQLLMAEKDVFEQLNLPLFQGKQVLKEQPTFYLCRNHTCSQPTNSLNDLIAKLGIAIE